MTRKIVPVDENLLREAIAGSTPITVSTEPAENPSETKEATEKEPEIVENPKARKPKKDKVGYVDIFLVRAASKGKNRTTVNINADVLDNYYEFIRGIDVISLSNFIDNILKHHFDTYLAEIKEIYKDKTNKNLNK